MEPGRRFSRFELKPSFSKGVARDIVEYFDFYVDGVPIRQRLSFESYDRLICGSPRSPFAELLHLHAQRLQLFSLSKGAEPYSALLKKAFQGEPGRLGHGSGVVQWEAVQEMLLRNEPGPSRRCRLFGCLNCNCHCISAVIEAIDGCFVWHSFLSEYHWQSATVELGGGPFFFDGDSYTEALETAIKL